MQIETTKLTDVLILTPHRIADPRGTFCETWAAHRLKEQGLNLSFVQDNQSVSNQKGTVRGLHFQAPPQAQDKLVRCGSGAIWDVAVDIRQGSPQFGQWVGVELSAENGRQLLVPQGFLHGFMTLTDACEVLYKCTAPYAPACDGAVAWDDPDLAIAWPDVGPAVLSQKDQSAPRLRDIKPLFKMPQAAA